MPRWTAAVVFAALSFGHALLLPIFEGMDEPAHLSSILQFATGHGRPEPDRARLHAAVERAISLAPGPYEQWSDLRETIGATTYSEWRRLPREEQQRRGRALAALPVDGWEDGVRENWQAQHPPLYYALVGALVRNVGGVSSGRGTRASAGGRGSFLRAHRVARLASAAAFATTGVILTIFLGRWGASRAAVLFVCLFPMWYVMGARITNDALAIPAFGLAALLAIDQMRRPASTWTLRPWLTAGAAGALALAAKAYGLALLPVAGVAVAIAVVRAARGHASWRVTTYPLATIVVTLAVNAWWLAENQANTGFITGQNENADLVARGVVTLADRMPYVAQLLFDEPGRLAMTLARAATQALYVSNWTFGAAPIWFYLLQLLALGLVLAGLRRRPTSTRPARTPTLGTETKAGVEAGAWTPRETATPTRTLQAAILVAALTVGTIVLGSAKAVVDFYILFGETRLAQGWYVWGAGVAVAAALALAFDTTSPRTRRIILGLELACLLTAFATDAMFWSGRYERHPVWRTPVRVAAQP